MQVISFEKHDLSQRAKDFGSAAVMLALILCFFSWVYILSGNLVP